MDEKLSVLKGAIIEEVVLDDIYQFEKFVLRKDGKRFELSIRSYDYDFELKAL